MTDYIKIDPTDIVSILNMLEGNTDRQQVVNYIKEYVYNPDFNKD